MLDEGENRSLDNDVNILKPLILWVLSIETMQEMETKIQQLMSLSHKKQHQEPSVEHDKIERNYRFSQQK